jgi:membrane dipeptidase
MTTTADRIRIFDLHCDTLDRLVENAAVPNFEFEDEEHLHLERAGSLDDNNCHLSLKRMEAFDWCQCFAIYVPDTLAGDAAWHFYTQIKRYFDEQLEKHAGRLEQIHNPARISGVLASGKAAALLTVEGGSFLETSLDHIEDLARDGVKMMTLTWNAPNALASGSTAHGGITPFGKQAVAALEHHGITVDVSHLNDESFADLQAIATRPFVASHSNARAICNHPRNLSDDQFRAIRDVGGLVGLNYFNEFLIEEKRPVTPEDIYCHINHWLELDGGNTIALGSDYDGADIPAWLDPGDQLPTLFDGVAHTFGRPIAERLFFTNAHRFFTAAATASLPR